MCVGFAVRLVRWCAVVSLLAALALCSSSPPVGAAGGTAYVGAIGDATTAVTDCGTQTNTDCTLRDAVAAVAGAAGAVQFGSGFPAGTQTILLGNGAGQGTLTLGSDVTIVGPVGQTAAISNLTVQHGTSNHLGGGIYSVGTLTVTNSTFSGNTAGNAGGGIDTIGSATVTNTIVAGNTGGDLGGTTTGSHNLVGGTPLLAPLGTYGGATQTFALLPGSPAIDAGTATGAPGTDQRGIARPQGSAVDIGAFESQGFTFSSPTGTPQSTLNNTAFATPLGITVASAHSEPVDGGQVIFTAPVSGASATFATSPATISGGKAGVMATANGTPGGPYTVTASATGVAGSALFSLTNTARTTTLAQNVTAPFSAAAQNVTLNAA